MPLRQDLDRSAEDLADSAGPPAGRIDHDVAVERAVTRRQPMTVPGRRVATEEFRVLEDTAATVPDRRRERVAEAVAVQVPVALAEEATGQVVDPQVRDQPSELVRFDDPAVGHPELALDGDTARECLHVLVAMAQAQVSVADDLEHTRAFERGERPHALHPDRDRDGVEILRLDDPDGQPGGGAGDTTTLDDRHVRDATLDELPGGAQPECARPDNDDGPGISAHGEGLDRAIPR